MLPDPRQSEALLAILDSGSFEQAAALLHVSPSAISQRIGAMEQALGAPLVIRGRPCRATAAGQHLVQFLRRSKLLEAEFLASRHDDDARPVSVALAVNNDTLATWLLPELAPFLIDEHLLLDLTLDDQDHTYALLEQGQVVAGISTSPQAMRGCSAAALGVMRYRMVAAPPFAARWLPDGLTREAARRAPLMVFDRRDQLQAAFLQREFGLAPGSYPCHYVPASDPYVQAIRLGLGYGMLPEQQDGALLESGALLDVAPGRYSDVMLYWHSWRIQSPRLERLSAAVVDAARRCLRAPESGQAPD